jgi:hypothetical protein
LGAERRRVEVDDRYGSVGITDKFDEVFDSAVPGQVQCGIDSFWGEPANAFDEPGPVVVAISPRDCR